MLRPPYARRNMNKQRKLRLLKALLILLILALIAVAGYILWREYQYGVSEDYYDSLRPIGRGAGLL